jgi:ABC-type sugar transport system permease subunit
MSIQGENEVFVGLENYRFIKSDYIFWKSLKNNGTLLLVVPIITILALVVTIFLYERVKGWKFYRSVVFLPFILPSVVIGIVFIYILEKNGILNTVLNQVGLGKLALDWLGNPKITIYTLMAVIIWRELGFGVVLILAAMLSLPEEINEAAKLDGANWFQEHVYVTIPQIKPVLSFFIIDEAISMLTGVFGYVYVLTGGGPGFETSVLELYIWKYAFAYKAYGVASAVAVILLLIISIIMIASMKSIKLEQKSATNFNY